MRGSIWAVASILGASVANAQNLPQASSPWYQQAQEALQERLANQPNTKRAKNVILFVADGNGVGTNYASRLFAGQQQGGLGDDYVQPFEAFPNVALIKTYSTNGQTPDSAPTASAMNSGIKTKNDLINVTENVAVSDCAAGLENGVRTFAEIAAEQGKSVGVVRRRASPMPRRRRSMRAPPTATGKTIPTFPKAAPSPISRFSFLTR